MSEQENRESGAPQGFSALPRQREYFPWQRAFDSAHGRVQGMIQRAAAQLARGDKARAQDLAQEGRVRLWELDASRLMPCDREWLEEQIWNRMREAARRELRHTGRRRRVTMEDAAGERPLLGLLEQEVAGWDG